MKRTESKTKVKKNGTIKKITIEDLGEVSDRQLEDVGGGSEPRKENLKRR